MPQLSPERLANLRRNNKVMFAALRVPCTDCGEHWHPLVMSFDHLDRTSKYKNPSNLRTYNPDVFDAELAKCEVVCLNCHQMREYLRDLPALQGANLVKEKQRYYERLVPYLTVGARINPLGFAVIPVTST